MKAIKFINSEDIIAIDIETVRIVKDYKDLSDNQKLAWQYKHKHEGVIPPLKELKELWNRTAPLYPEFSKVCSVSIAYLSNEKLKCKQYTSEDEFLILESLAEDLNKFKKFNPKFRLLGHDSKHFDYPFLCKRYIINSMDIPSILDESDAKPWEQTLLDTYELWKSFGSFSNSGSSLLALCVALDIEVSKVDLVGDEVGASYFDGKLKEIGYYCCLDAISTYNIFRRFKGEKTLLFSEVNYVNKDEVLSVKNKAKKVEEPLLIKMFNADNITDKDIKELTKVSKKLSPKEKVNLSVILMAIVKGKPTEKQSNFIEWLKKD